MIGHPLGLRINPDPSASIKDQLRAAAAAGARAVVLDAAGDLAPARLSETGRREIRHLLRSTELGLIALHLPARRPFDTLDQLEDRLARAESACALAYELGVRIVLARVGPIPPDGDADARRRAAFAQAIHELTRRADRHGIRLALETEGPSAEALRAVIDAEGSPALAASLDPAALLRLGHDPAMAIATLGTHVAHAYYNDATASARVAHPGGFGYPPGALDLEAYLGAMEEVGYRGFLTLWPDPNLPQAPQVAAMFDRIRRI